MQSPIDDLSALVRPPRPFADRARFVILMLLGVAFYVLCLNIAQVDFARLWAGLPRLANWAARAWPPDLSEFSLLTQRAAETVAMGVVGTSFGMIIAAPLCLLAARNVTPSRLLWLPARGLLNILRGVDSFVFALLLVAAVGLGPFAGVLGLALHSAGSIAKLWSETIETAKPGPIEAVAMSGASRLKVIRHAMLPDVLPSLASISLYMLEWSVRASTVLGVVGAGGIGQELKNSVDLLAFDRVFTILLLILAMVTIIDSVSGWLRKRLL
ncbi:MAG: phosphonate ABC transporter, permease protein PhnE [Beijerinckiaceae bacterium]|nr:phosphonate ABC transporter, permease protein PhnE [Beijerinckiaceae bacterium]